MSGVPDAQRERKRGKERKGTGATTKSGRTRTTKESVRTGMGSQLSSLVPQKGSPRAHQTWPGRSSAAHQPITSPLPSRRSVSGAQAPTSLASSASAPTPTTRLPSQWTPAASSSPPRPLELVVLPTSRSTRPRSDGRRADGLEQLGTDVCARHQPVSDVNALSVHCPSPDSRVSFILLPRALAQRRSPSPSSRDPQQPAQVHTATSPLLPSVLRPCQLPHLHTRTSVILSALILICRGPPTAVPHTAHLGTIFSHIPPRRRQRPTLPPSLSESRFSAHLDARIHTIHAVAVSAKSRPVTSSIFPGETARP